MEKYCKSCGRVFNNLKFKMCPYCGLELSTRYGRQPIPRKLRHIVFKRDGYRCRECGASKDETSLEIDHILPVAKGGTNDIDNLQTLCRECNRMKHTDEWVGGEDTVKVARNELSNLKNQLQEAETKLIYANNSDDVIEYKFKIKKLTTTLIPAAQEKLDKLKQEKYVADIQKKIMKEKDKLFKKLYVELDDDLILSLRNYFSLNKGSSEEILRELTQRFDENEINDAISEIKKDEKNNLIEKKRIYDEISNKLDEDATIMWIANHRNWFNSKDDLINYLVNSPPHTRTLYIDRIERYEWFRNNKSKMSLYNKLFDKLTDEEIKILNDYHLHTDSRGELVFFLVNAYNESRIYEIINNEKSKK